ncbi:phosphonate transporter [Rhodopseudomonas sp. WA056]|uniref:BLUF domain-containing protein n=1 Tax=Rhodopseudomonas sp. WA056 TaxID=2269367 RepID=UPI0013DEB88D|nr:BLUF domain-containing protein [Rhodopseudomonas sp. WA056]NEW86102.1 phosphonate transporter [Rhodopseudomonas sp. WA056]
MQAELFRVLYVSRNRIAGGLDSLSSEIADILATSRAHNEREGITGALIFNSGFFAQVLEGPRSAVEAVFEAIQQDGRHSDVQVLLASPIAVRAFPNWAMAHVGQSPRHQHALAWLQTETGFHAGHLVGERLYTIVMEMAHAQETDDVA